MSHGLTAEQIIERMESLYEKIGASAVYDEANRLGLDDWNKCQPCDAKTPFLDGDCLVCGTSTEGG